jgi:dephospho-CoA kinase
MLRVGLTGSIAVGKSFVSYVLAKLDCHVLDADVAAREVVAAGSPGLRAVTEAFGSGVLSSEGTLDRVKLGALVFNNEAERLRLNAILHPFIFEMQDAQLRVWEATDPHGIGVVDAALMIESGGYRRFDKLIVVHCRPEIQLERLMTRNRFTREEALKRIATQMPQEEKLLYADYAIDSSDGFDETRAQVENVYAKLRDEVVAGTMRIVE